MHKLKNRGIAVLTVIGLFALSGIALAEIHEDIEPEDDTLFNFGSDEQFIFWNVTQFDEATAKDTYDNCALEGDYEYSFDGGDVLLTETDPVVSENNEEVAAIECGTTMFDDATGPNGQLNHGMFVKTFNEMFGEFIQTYEGTVRRGCLMRHVAQSDMGKGPDHVTVSEAQEQNGVVEPAQETTPTVDFETILENCVNEKEGGGNGGPPAHVLEKHAEKRGGGGPGKPDHAGGPGGRP